jgi:hypothetical protein
MARTTLERATLRLEAGPAAHDLDAVVDADSGHPPEEGWRRRSSYDRYMAAWFPRYVAAYERNATRVRSLHLANFHFRFFDGGRSPAAPGRSSNSTEHHRGNEDADSDDSDDDDEASVRARGHIIRAASARFFSSVLPHLSRLTCLSFEDCAIDPADFQAFFEALPQDRLVENLLLSGVRLDRECIQIVADALLHRNLRLHKLWVTGNRMDYDLYKSICDSAGENPHVRLLALCPSEWEGDRMLDADAVRRVLSSSRHPPSSSPSSLRHFRISCEAGMGPDSLGDIVRMLRTNETLDVFDILGMDGTERSVEELLDLLRTHNVTLRRITLWGIRGGGLLDERESQDRIDRALSRNVRLKGAYERMCQQVPRVRTTSGSGISGSGGGYQPQPPLGPEAIARIGAVPTLLYRLLRRHGYAAALVDQVAAPQQQQQQQQQQQGRRRRDQQGGTEPSDPN